jgi:hypothetical protein
MSRAKNKYPGKTALQNPDNWCYFALAMYQLQNQDANEAYYDFATGSTSLVK